MGEVLAQLGGRLQPQAHHSPGGQFVLSRLAGGRLGRVVGVLAQPDDTLLPRRAEDLAAGPAKGDRRSVS